MIVDHRTYRIKHGRNKEYIAIFEELGLPVQRKHLGEPLAYFETAIGPVNEVVHLWGYESLADMEKRRAARDADPAWTVYKEKSAGMLEHQENKILKPTHFSLMK
ncbi:MAG: NIPSNAP family protein [Rhodospirillaceae bacterium]